LNDFKISIAALIFISEFFNDDSASRNLQFDFKKRTGYRCIANFAKALSTTVIEEKYGYSFFF
jgi:hypothetical protein